MRPIALLLAIAGSTACASSGSKPSTDISTPSERIVATDNQTTLRTTVAPNSRVNIPAAPNRVFDALTAIYPDLGIPSPTADATTGRVGNTNFWKSRKLGAESISTFLNCGSSITGVIADTYRVYMSVVSVARPDGNGGTELETAFNAYAQNMEGTAGDRIPCGTTGRLEEVIQKLVARKVGVEP